MHLRDLLHTADPLRCSSDAYGRVVRLAQPRKHADIPEAEVIPRAAAGDDGCARRLEAGVLPKRSRETGQLRTSCADREKVERKTASEKRLSHP